MIRKFYYPIPKGGKNSGGYIDLNEVHNLKPILNERRCTDIKLHQINGDYRPFYGFYLVDLFCICEEWKVIIEKHLDVNSGVEFIPVEVISKDYGNRTQYIVRFTKQYDDIIDLKHSKTIEDPFQVVVPALQYEKVKDLSLFQIPDTMYDFVMSGKIYSEIKKAKLTKDTTFSPVWSISKDDPKY